MLLRMDDKTLIQISIVFSIIGIIALYFFSSSVVVDNYEISQMEDSSAVKVQGTINKVTHKKGITIIELEQTSVVEVVIYDNLFFKKNTTLEVIGKVDTYQGKKQVVAEKIKTTTFI